MNTITEYYMNNGDRRLDDANITPEDWQEPAPATVDAYFPQSFKLQTSFGLLYSPDKRSEDELSRLGGKSIKTVVTAAGTLKKGNLDFATVPAAKPYDQVELPRAPVKWTPEMEAEEAKVQNEKVKY
jgi:hypothetical protein